MLMSLKIYHKISIDLQWLQLKLRGLWYMRREHDVPQAILDLGFGLLFYLESCKVGLKGNPANDSHKKFPSLIFKHWLKSLFFCGLFLQPFSTRPGRCLPPSGDLVTPSGAVCGQTTVHPRMQARVRRRAGEQAGRREEMADWKETGRRKCKKGWKAGITN